MSDNKPLITKYRPSTFDEVIGHASILRPLQRAIHSDTTPHAYLFTGVAGLGKTSLARIVATELGAEVMEFDAAGNSGIDAAREIVEMGNHMSLRGSGRRAFIIDECHALSKPAWQALLKLVEEPPSHLFIMLCTTETAKVPVTIVSRCYPVPLRPLKPQEISDLLEVVISCEGWEVAGDVFSTIVEAATGQPRKALSILDAVHDAPSREEVKRIIQLIDSSDPLFELCAALTSNKGWAVINPLLAKIDDAEFDGAFYFVGRFLIGGMAATQNDAQAAKNWRLLDAFLFPSETFDRKAQFYAAVGRVIWGGP